MTTWIIGIAAGLLTAMSATHLTTNTTAQAAGCCAGACACCGCDNCVCEECDCCPCPLCG